MKIIGVNVLNYKSRKTGKQVQGVSLYYEDSQKITAGSKVDNLFMSVNNFSRLLSSIAGNPEDAVYSIEDITNLANVVVGYEFTDFSYNRYGNAIGVIVPR